MPWGAQQWLRCTREASYGVRNVGAGTAPSADVIYVRLYTDTAFTMRPTPIRQVIRTADAGNRRRQVVAARTSLAGSLQTLLSPSVANFWLTAATKVGNTYANDLDSFTVDYYDSTRVLGILGVKVGQLQFTSSAEQDYIPLSLNLTGQQVDSAFTAFPQPADAYFETAVPWEHVECAGLISVGGAPLTKYKSLGVTIANTLHPSWDENRYISSLWYTGRDIDWNFNSQYMNTTWRTNFEATNALSATLQWSRAGHGMYMNMETKNYLGSIEDSIPLGGAAYQQVGVQSFYDGSNTGDFAFTAG